MTDHSPTTTPARVCRDAGSAGRPLPGLETGLGGRVLAAESPPAAPRRSRTVDTLTSRLAVPPSQRRTSRAVHRAKKEERLRSRSDPTEEELLGER